ncbi:MAG: hypothetical protein LH481_17740 [Burkholderiales bacterium]|nr:hypothetical protein [Burkholderiales bacterium]
MQTHQYLFIGTGAVIAAIGLWYYLTLPRLRAAHAADIASRELITGEVVDYEFDSEDNKYTRLIEYEVNGHRYRMRGREAVPAKGKPLAPVRLAYKRDKRSDAIEVERDFSGDTRFAKGSIVIGVVFILLGVFG